MNWLELSLSTIIFYSLFDFFLKLSSDKIHSGLGSFIINLTSAIVLFVYLIYLRFSGDRTFEIKSGGLLYSIISGIAIGLASIFFIRLFALGTNLSVGVPLVRIGMVILGSILGIFILKEGFNIKYIIGLIVSLFGLYLIITAK